MTDFVQNEIFCSICNLPFASKNKLFKHLALHGYVGQKLEKIALIIGWKSNVISDSRQWKKECNTNHSWVEGDDRVENALWTALKVTDGVDSLADESNVSGKPKGFSRGSSCAQRASYLLSREESCHGVCDVICIPVRPCADREHWLGAINSALPDDVRVLSRISLPRNGVDFHAEASSSQRRYEYMVPLAVLFDPTLHTSASSPLTDDEETVNQYRIPMSDIIASPLPSLSLASEVIGGEDEDAHESLGDGHRLPEGHCGGHGQGDLLQKTQSRTALKCSV